MVQPRRFTLEECHGLLEARAIQGSKASQAHDRQVQLPLHAQAGIPEVWLESLEGKGVEVYRDPPGGAYPGVREPSPEDTLYPRAFPQV
ncbi:Uma2 family endonuclease [Thermus sp.]|uniref:Uma2 family endonuclease n=1 Tax=Thermus sp. TaxID=275 RepID=UPI00391C6E83